MPPKIWRQCKLLTIEPECPDAPSLTLCNDPATFVGVAHFAVRGIPMLERVAEFHNRGRGIFAGLKDVLASISPRRWELIAGLIAPALLFGALLSGEAILRIQQMRAFGPNEAVETNIAAEVWQVVDGRRRPRPNAVMGHIHFNSSGFRGEELATPKPEGLIRVGFFGTSTTMDPYVDSESDTWSAVAVTRLREAFPKCTFDYLNAGIAGYNLAGVERRLIQDAMPFKPDIAILMVNDIDTRGRTLAGERDNQYKPGWLARHSLLWLKVEKTALAERLKRVATRMDAAKRLDLDALARGARRDIRLLLDHIKGFDMLPVLVENSSRLRREQPLSEQGENADSVVLYLPNVFVGDVTAAFYRYNEELKSAARDYSLPYVETMNALPADAEHYVDTHHTTKTGSRMLGQVVGDSLAHDPAIRAVIRERGKGCAAAS